MKWIGIVAALALIIACFFLAVMYLLLTLIPRVWAKRWNLLIIALNIGWAARNYLIISACSGGECPEKKTALYIVLISSLVMLVAALFPKMELSSGNVSN